ncbi:MAG: hypothetical protein ACT4PT_05060 [Methanobacteriota archaeon]
MMADALHVVAGSLAVFVLPGLPWTYALFPRDALEGPARAALTVVFSLVLVVGVLHLSNVLLDVPMGYPQMILTIVLVAAAGTAVAVRRALEERFAEAVRSAAARREA